MARRPDRLCRGQDRCRPRPSRRCRGVGTPHRLAGPILEWPPLSPATGEQRHASSRRRAVPPCASCYRPFAARSGCVVRVVVDDGMWRVPYRKPDPSHRRNVIPNAHRFSEVRPAVVLGRHPLRDHRNRPTGRAHPRLAAQWRRLEGQRARARAGGLPGGDLRPPRFRRAGEAVQWLRLRPAGRRPCGAARRAGSSRRDARRLLDGRRRGSPLHRPARPGPAPLGGVRRRGPAVLDADRRQPRRPARAGGG